MASLRMKDRWRGMRKQPLMAAALVFSILAAVYWLVIASDRYVSESHVIVQQTDLASSETPSLTSLLAGDSAGNRVDQLLMRDYLLSRDVVVKLNEELDLMEHYSDWSIDPFSRLNFANSIDDLHDYYLDRVTIEYDEYGGVLVIQAQAFDPVTAKKMADMLVAEGGSFMNAMAQGLADEQVSFLQGKVQELNQKSQAARQAVLGYQNRNRIASPEAQSASITQLIGQLEAQRSSLQVQLASQSAFLVEDHPTLVELRRQIAAINAQIASQNDRLAGPRGGTLNNQVEELTRLEADAQFAEELYRTALASLEKGQVDSTRTIKTLSIIQQPSLPQEAGLPDRWRNSIIFAIVAFLVAGILQLLAMILRDHRD